MQMTKGLDSTTKLSSTKKTVNMTLIVNKLLVEELTFEILNLSAKEFVKAFFGVD